MSDDRKDLPPVNSPNFLEKVREAVQTYLGNRGATLDRGITLRDLTESGLVTLRANFGKGSSNPIGGPGSLILDGVVYEPDLTPPPMPTGFAATAAISNLLVECDPQTYTQGHGHAKSKLYGATWTSGPLPVFANAQVITEFSGTVASHATNPATTWHLWLTWLTVDGVESTSPAGGTNGVVSRTGEDVALLLEVLTGEITASQLYADLGSRIDLIDGTQAGSVNARLATESAARVAALASETSSRVAALVVEATNRTNAIQNEAGIRAQGILDEALARANGDSTLQSQVNLLTAASSGDLGDLISAVETEQTARIAGDAAEATARQTLATQFRGAYTGTDITQVTTGLVYSERTARTTADSAIASSVSTLSTIVANNLTTVNAAITAEATTRANADTAEATSRSTLQTKMIGAANPATATLASLTTGLVYDERSARSTADSTELTARQLLSTKMVGATDPTGKTLANVTSGLIFDERTTRSNETGALATRTSTLESTVNNAATGVLATANALDVVETLVNNAATGVTATATKTSLLESKMAAVEFVTSIADTRNTNEPPSYYVTNFPRKAVKEFKTRSVIGAPGSGTYGDLTTTTRWSDLSGGPVTQVFAAGDSLEQYARYSTSATAWSAWKSDVLNLQAANALKADATALTTTNTNVTNLSGVVTAQGSRVTTLETSVNSGTTGLATKASVSQVATAKAEAIAASASVTDTISARLNTGDFAAVQVQSTASASSVTGLLAQYTVKLDVGGKVSGYGLASSSTSSEFAIRADRFYIAPPATGGGSATQIIPFVVQATATTINGVAVPAGVYINDAYIKNGTITNAKIGDAQIDNAKIASLSAAKITAGTVAAGDINSTGTTVVNGSTVPSWTINGNGTATFNNAVVRGTVYANAGQIGGITIAENAVRAGQTAYNTGQGFFLGSNGTFSLGNSAGNRLTWDGTNLNVVGGGTFSGDISAATGTFGGNVHGGQFTTGAYTGYAWPAVNNYGTYVGPSGLLLGNANNGKYVQITQTGDIYTPGFNVINGTMTVNQANVINTLNIAGNSVTVPSSAFTAAGISVNDGTVVQSLSVVSTGGPIFIFASFTAGGDGNTTSLGLRVSRNGTVITSATGGGATGSKSVALSASCTDTPGAGSHTYTISAAKGPGVWTVSYRSLLALEVKR